MRAYRNKNEKLFLISKIAAFWYVLLLTVIMLITPTFAGFNDIEEISETVTAGTWAVPWSQTSVDLSVDKEILLDSCDDQARVEAIVTNVGEYESIAGSFFGDNAVAIPVLKPGESVTTFITVEVGEVQVGAFDDGHSIVLSETVTVACPPPPTESCENAAEANAVMNNKEEMSIPVAEGQNTNESADFSKELSETDKINCLPSEVNDEEAGEEIDPDQGEEGRKCIRLDKEDTGQGESKGKNIKKDKKDCKDKDKDKNGLVNNKNDQEGLTLPAESSDNNSKEVTPGVKEEEINIIPPIIKDKEKATEADSEGSSKDESTQNDSEKDVE